MTLKSARHHVDGLLLVVGLTSQRVLSQLTHLDTSGQLATMTNAQLDQAVASWLGV